MQFLILVKILEKLDPERLKEIDQNNPVRLIRAIEIAKVLGKVPKIKEDIKYDQGDDLSETISIPTRLHDL